MNSGAFFVSEPERMKMSAPHLQHQTRLSREGKLDLTNRKPYRTKALKTLAREDAELCKDGTYRSDVAVRYHPEVRG